MVVEVLSKFECFVYFQFCMFLHFLLPLPSFATQKSLSESMLLSNLLVSTFNTSQIKVIEIVPAMLLGC